MASTSFIEGNRRLTAVTLLNDPELGWGSLTKSCCIGCSCKEQADGRFHHTRWVRGRTRFSI